MPRGFDHAEDWLPPAFKIQDVTTVSENHVMSDEVMAATRTLRWNLIQS
jgi:hypothetical protein